MYKINTNFIVISRHQSGNTLGLILLTSKLAPCGSVVVALVLYFAVFLYAGSVFIYICDAIAQIYRVAPALGKIHIIRFIYLMIYYYCISASSRAFTVCQNFQMARGQLLLENSVTTYIWIILFHKFEQGDIYKNIYRLPNNRIFIKLKCFILISSTNFFY